MVLMFLVTVIIRCAHQFVILFEFWLWLRLWSCGCGCGRDPSFPTRPKTRWSSAKEAQNPSRIIIEHTISSNNSATNLFVAENETDGSLFCSSGAWCFEGGLSGVKHRGGSSSKTTLQLPLLLACKNSPYYCFIHANRAPEVAVFQKPSIYSQSKSQLNSGT